MAEKRVAGFVESHISTSRCGAPGVQLHLYEKHNPRKGRKVDMSRRWELPTPEEAVKRVLEAEKQL